MSKVHIDTQNDDSVLLNQMFFIKNQCFYNPEGYFRVRSLTFYKVTQPLKG